MGKSYVHPFLFRYAAGRGGGGTWTRKEEGKRMRVKDMNMDHGYPRNILAYRIRNTFQLHRPTQPPERNLGKQHRYSDGIA